MVQRIVKKSVDCNEIVAIFTNRGLVLRKCQHENRYNNSLIKPLKYVVSSLFLTWLIVLGGFFLTDSEPYQDLMQEAGISLEIAKTGDAVIFTDSYNYENCVIDQSVNNIKVLKAKVKTKVKVRFRAMYCEFYFSTFKLKNKKGGYYTCASTALNPEHYVTEYYLEYLQRGPPTANV